MKLSEIIDAEDVGIIAKAAILAALASGGLVVAAAAFGLAWTVVRLFGGF